MESNGVVASSAGSAFRRSEERFGMQGRLESTAGYAGGLSGGC